MVNEMSTMPINWWQVLGNTEARNENWLGYSGNFSWFFNVMFKIYSDYLKEFDY